MKRILLLLFFLPYCVFAQSGTLTMDSCIRYAKANYPLIKQNAMIAQMEKNRVEIVNKNWLPKVSFLSQATYQSEVPEFPLPGISFVFPKDQYTNALDVEQTLFDAGQTHNQKLMEKMSAESELEKNEIELYKLVDRVNQYYSNILIARANLKTLNVYKDDIANKQSSLASAFKNGKALQSNLDALEAEELKTEQSIIEARNNLDALYKGFSLLINKPLNDQTELSSLPVGGTNQTQRPELKLFSSQKDLLNAKYKYANKAAFPKISVFGEGVYGRPGYNFLDQNMRLFGKAGISLKWNLSLLYNLNKEKQNLEINRQMIDVQQEVFEFNRQATLASQETMVTAYKEILEKDKTIIEKRHSVTKTASVQLENGSITTADYLLELNAEMQATLSQKIHEVKLMNAISTYNATMGIAF